MPIERASHGAVATAAVGLKTASGQNAASVARQQPQSAKSLGVSDNSSTNDNISRSRNLSADNKNGNKDDSDSVIGKTGNETVDMMKKKLDEFNSYMNSQKKKNSATLGGLLNRMKAGSTLSPIDILYVKKNAPGQYAKLKRSQVDAAKLRQQLKLCKTKGQVLSLRTNVTQTAIYTNGDMENTSPSSQDSMTTSFGLEAYSYHATNAEWNNFRNSKAYLKLPYKLRKGRCFISRKV